MRDVASIPKSDLRQSRGFTLIELVVVAGLVCVLVSLLLPAVQQAREAARRTKCKQRVSQLMIALSNYHDAHKVFPPGTVNASGPVYSNSDGLLTSWLVQLLPHLDEHALAVRHIPELSVDAPEHDVLRSTPVSAFLCPSQLPIEPGSPAYSNYAGVAGGEDVPIHSDNRGMFFLNSSLALIHVRDGSSNQFAIGERRFEDNPSGVERGWICGTSVTLRNAGFLPNAVSASSFRYDRSELALDETAGGFSSHHTGIVQFGIADGSVRAISENIELELFRNLCITDDGHEVGEY